MAKYGATFVKLVARLVGAAVQRRTRLSLNALKSTPIRSRSWSLLSASFGRACRVWSNMAVSERLSKAD